MISYSKVSRRGYLVASDDAFVCSVISYSEVKIGLETPQKEQKLVEKVSEEKFILSRDGAGKHTESRWG